MRIIWIYSVNFPICHRAVLAITTMLYITLPGGLTYEVTQSCLTLRDPMDCSLPASSVHGSFQARVLEWGAITIKSKKDPERH